jgi:alpha-L-fucosidase
MQVAAMKKRVATAGLYLIADIILVASCWAASAQGQADRKEVEAEHELIGNTKLDPKTLQATRTTHPDSQWFPDAGMGVMLSWDPATVKPIALSWPMIPGRELVGKNITPAEFDRIVRERDFDLNGKKWPVTPNKYWALAKEFLPDNYHPEAWLKKVKEAGFTYAVFTTKHHNGFAMWPSAYGNFNTKNYMGGRDLVKDFVEGCRKAGLKVGLYFSPPDWYFDRDYFNFLYHRAAKENPGLPALDADLQPRTASRTPEETRAHHKAYAAMVRGQVEELLTNYGKIDLLWFDGKPSIPDGQNAISLERIRELQPGIVVNARMHGKGDYITPERHLPESLKLGPDEWGEFCTPWNYWSYVKKPFRPLNTILTELVRSRNAGVNYLIGFGPMPNGDLAPEAYENMAKLGDWMKVNSESIYGTRALPDGESASVLSASKGDLRYLYLLPQAAEGPVRVSITGYSGNVQAEVLGGGAPLEVSRDGNKVTVAVPAGVVSADVVRVIKLSPKA